MKILFSYFQQFSLPNVCKTRLQADFVTNNQILVVKIIKIRPPSYSPTDFELFEKYPFKRQSHKLVKHTQKIRRHFVGELFECG